MGLRKTVLLSALVSSLSAFSQEIWINQLGYSTGGVKRIQVAGGNSKSFSLVDEKTGKKVFEGRLGKQAYWDLSGDNVQTADFSSFAKEGTYRIKVGDKRSHPFQIARKGVYDELNQWVIKAFYLWRASTPIEAKYATFKGTSFARAMGHPDTAVYWNAPATNGGMANYVEHKLSSPKGWYDAGDYNKYTVNAGYSCEFLGMLYEMYPEFYQQLELNIPESGNGVPDLLDELKWELDWLLTMQDEDGGVFFKLTTKAFSRFVMPEFDLNDRYMIGKSTTSALNFAAALAMAARLYKPYEAQFPGYSGKALSAAKKAFEWARQHPYVPFANPRDVTTGGYTDTSYVDEFQMAATELLVTTKDVRYAQYVDLDALFNTPTWPYVATMHLLQLQLHSRELEGLVDVKKVERRFVKLADSLYTAHHQCVGLIPIDVFRWGSNCEVAGAGCIAGIAYRVTGDKKYLGMAVDCFDYLLGRNATGYCFVSGFGSKSPKNLHDRRCEADGIAEPLPGYLCGGPNAGARIDCGEERYSKFPARSYFDAKCSYSTNEIAVNWNAPMALLTGLIVNEIDR